MCGIGAVVAFDERSRSTAARDVITMHGRVPHRGPDGDGFALVGCDLTAHAFSSPAALAGAEVAARVALAFRWLIVQDASLAAAQPMASSDGLKWLLHNGEIYNDPELRDELSRMGHSFCTRSDAEVILAAYEEWGTECFKRFNGMWAIVIADVSKRRVVISRDRFGIRPMFYSQESGRVLLATEIKQILQLLQSVRQNEHYIYSYLNEGTLMHFDQETFFEGVRTVPPASFAVIDIDAPQKPLRFESYWDPSVFQKRPPAAKTFEEAAAGFSGLLKSAVELTLRTEATLGSFLSGGLDSSVLSAMILERNAENETYSIVFDRAKYAPFDESPYVDDFVARHHCRNARASLDAEWLRTT